MTAFAATMDRDGNRQIIGGEFPFREACPIVFGGVADDPGDISGANSPFTVLTVTGVIQARVIAHVKTAFTTATQTETLSLGTAGDDGYIIGAIGDTYLGTAGSMISFQDFGDGTNIIYDYNFYNIADDIIMTIGGEDVTAGEVDFYFTWRPLSDDGNAVGHSWPAA